MVRKMTSRKKHHIEFKLDAVSLVLDQQYTRAETARSIGINQNMLGLWIKEHESDDGQRFRGNGKLSPVLWRRVGINIQALLFLGAAYLKCFLRARIAETVRCVYVPVRQLLQHNFVWRCWQTRDQPHTCVLPCLADTFLFLLLAVRACDRLDCQSALLQVL